jgi:uncharacterized protein (DUF305 family)
MRRSLSVVAVLVALLGLTACSNHAAAPDPAGDASAADAMFAQMMIPHHEQAVVMADLAPTRAQDPQIIELATEIKGAQQPEIDQMAAWLEEWGVPRLAGDEAMAAHGSHGMSGMLTDEQLAELEASSGTDFDQLFAQLMIEHHEGAIEMANAVVDSSDPRVAQLAQQIIRTQEAEIEQLRPLAGS